MSGSASPAAPYYSSCDRLNRDYGHGVAKSKRAARKQVRWGFEKPAAGPRTRAVYRENHSGLDADDDGNACEVTR